MILDDWQRYVLEQSLGETVDGKWTAFEVCLLVPRQNGKGSILEARELAGLFLFDEMTILHSAHEFKTAWEAFLRVRTLIDNTPDLAAKVKQIRQSHADVCIELKSGARLRFVARSGGSGRGFSADCVVIDEAYRLDGSAMAALLPTLSARPNPQVWYTSSAPMETSEVLHRVRSRAIAGGEARLAFFEWSAPEDADTDDPDVWALANPAFEVRVPESFVSAECAALPEPEFRRERLGIPDDPFAVSRIVPPEKWAECVDSGSTVTPSAWAVDVSEDSGWASIALAGVRPDGKVHVELVENRPGTEWLANRLVELQGSHGGQVLVDGSSPAGFLLPTLGARGCQVRVVSTREHSQACGMFLDAVLAGSVVHIGQVQVASALAGAKKRNFGDAWVWARRSSGVDITPVVAVTLALFGANDVPPPVAAKPVFAF